MTLLLQLLLFLSGAMISSSQSTTGGTFTDTQQQSILDYHNYYRANKTVVQASNMMELQWDSYLATEAYNLAKTCVFQHYTDNYGQNLYMAGGSSVTADSIIQKSMVSWCDEEIVNHEDDLLAEARAGLTEIGANQDYDHVSQVLWAKTSSVGCGYATCSNMLMYVCNYYPAGNYRGEPWFEYGSACSDCPSGTVCNNGLCSSDTSNSADSIVEEPTSLEVSTTTTTTTLPVTVSPDVIILPNTTSTLSTTGSSASSKHGTKALQMMIITVITFAIIF